METTYTHDYNIKVVTLGEVLVGHSLEPLFLNLYRQWRYSSARPCGTITKQILVVGVDQLLQFLCVGSDIARVA